MNRAAERLALVTDRSVRCPECRGCMEFKTDRAGRAMEVCACGYRAYIERRTGDRVTCALSPYDLSRGRIIYRHK